MGAPVLDMIDMILDMSFGISQVCLSWAIACFIRPSTETDKTMGTNKKVQLLA